MIARYVGLFSFHEAVMTDTNPAEIIMIARYVGLFLFHRTIVSLLIILLMIARYVGLFSFHEVYGDAKVYDDAEV